MLTIYLTGNELTQNLYNNYFPNNVRENITLKVRNDRIWNSTQQILFGILLNNKPTFDEYVAEL